MSLVERDKIMNYLLTNYMNTKVNNVVCKCCFNGFIYNNFQDGKGKKFYLVCSVCGTKNEFEGKII